MKTNAYFLKKLVRLFFKTWWITVLCKITPSTFLGVHAGYIAEMKGIENEVDFLKKLRRESKV